MTQTTNTTISDSTGSIMQNDLFDDDTITIIGSDTNYDYNYPYTYATDTIDLSSIGTNTVNISDYIYPMSNGQGNLSVNGDAEIEGDLKVQGKSIVDMIENIEKRLAILHPNPELESKWEELKSLGEKYRQLEKEILDKEKCWNILKK